jgi:hypothetical protein
LATKERTGRPLGFGVAGCSPLPYTGEKITETTTPQGLKVIQTSSRSKLPTGGLAGQESELAQMTATIDSIDKKGRVVTVKTQDNRLVSIKAGPDVRNLEQLKKGDTLELDYFEAVDFEVRQPTEEEKQIAGLDIDVAARATEGEKPAGIVAGERVDILTVESIDKKKQLITLKAPEGYVTVKAKYPQNLRMLKIGDTVVVKTSELFAVHTKQVG